MFYRTLIRHPANKNIVEAIYELPLDSDIVNKLTRGLRRVGSFVITRNGGLEFWRRKKTCASGRTRTFNPLIKSQLLYQLSHGRMLSESFK